MPKKIDHERNRQIILEFIEKFLDEYDAMPSVREIADGTGIPATTAYRTVKTLNDEGLIKYKGHTRRTVEYMPESRTLNVEVIGYVSCGAGEEEEEQHLGFIPLSKDMVGNHDYYALIAKGESMIDAGVNPGDYVIVQSDRQAKFGDIVVALMDGVNNLKVLAKGDDEVVCYLRSRNADKERYPDIPVTNELRIQGVARYVIHQFGRLVD